MAVKASRTSSSLNGLMIAITIFMGLVPRLDSVKEHRAVPTEIHHAEKVTTRAQPKAIESNAVPVPLTSETVSYTVLFCWPGAGVERCHRAPPKQWACQLTNRAWQRLRPGNAQQASRL